MVTVSRSFSSTCPVEVIAIVNTKIELSHNKIARTRDLDELAAILFPANKNHQRVFLAIFIELKYAEHEFLNRSFRDNVLQRQIQ